MINKIIFNKIFGIFNKKIKKFGNLSSCNNKIFQNKILGD